MLLKTPFTAVVLGASAVLATDVRTAFHQAFSRSSSLAERQSYGGGGGSGNITDIIPAACQSICATTLQYVQDCSSAKSAPACLSICTQSGLNGFVQCLQCGINAGSAAEINNIQSVNAAITQVAAQCNAAGSSVSAATLAATSVPLSGYTSATGSMSGSTTAAASQTGSGSSSMSVASSGSTASGVTASSGAATSKSASSAVVPFNIAHAAGAAVIGLIGVAGGAALAL